MKYIILLLISVSVFANSMTVCSDDELVKNYKNGLKLINVTNTSVNYFPMYSASISGDTMSLPIVQALKPYPGYNPTKVGYVTGFVTVNTKTNIAKVNYLVSYTCSGTDLGSILGGNPTTVSPGSAVYIMADAARRKYEKH